MDGSVAHSRSAVPKGNIGSPAARVVQELLDGTRWMLRLDPGEELFDRIGTFARTQKIRAGTIVEGIGFLSHASVAYWNGREYDAQEIGVGHELVGLHGSIAEVDGAPSLHLHGALAGPDHRVIGGHFLRGTVGILVELHGESFPGRVFGRPLEETLGLRRLDLCPGPAPPV